MLTIVTLLVAWGVLTFGAVYPWAYQPLGLAIIALALWRARRGVSLKPVPIVAACALLLLACAVQLVPLSISTLGKISPSTTRFLSAFDVRVAVGTANKHGLSVVPSETQRGTGFLLVLFVWVATCASVLRRSLVVTTLARDLTALGAIIAVLGLAQKATFNGKLLWFWTPMYYSSNAFGPFVDRNHFAGWMILALGIGVGSLFGRLSTLKTPNIRGWRERVLWLDSPEALAPILTAAAVFVMAISLVWTMSRSGIAGAGVALTLLMGAAAYRARGHVQRFLLVAYLIFAVVGVVAWRGADTLFNWYGNTTTLDWRIDLWKDTMRPLNDFWRTGSGLNTYGTLMRVYPRTDVTVDPVEAHNDYLQLAVEGGVLVSIPVFLLIIALGREILKRLKQPQDEMTWWIRMGAVAGICGVAVQELTDFSLQIPGVALLFGTCVGIALHQSAPLEMRRPRVSTREQKSEMARAV